MKKYQYFEPFYITNCVVVPIRLHYEIKTTLDFPLKNCALHVLFDWISK